MKFEALDLESEVKFKVKKRGKIIVDTTILVDRLTKKEEKKIMLAVEKAKEKIGDDAAEALDDIEEAAKEKFKMMVSGDDISDLKKFADEYGYTLVMQRIEELKVEAKGK